MVKNKKLIMIIAIVMVLILGMIVVTFISKQNKGPKDEMYITTQNGTIQATRGAYKWKTLTQEIVTDSQSPYTIALWSTKVKAYQFETVTITTNEVKGRLLDDISNVKLYLINETTSKEVEMTKDSREMHFLAPKEMGDYYYHLIVTYKNGSVVEYAFAMNVGRRKMDTTLLNETITRYKGTYIGDNTSVIHLTNRINSEINTINVKYNDVKFSISGNDLTVNYIMNEKDVLQDTLLKEWNLNYATVMFALINDLNNLNVIITNEAGKELYVNSYSKQNIEEIYNSKLENIILHEIFLENMSDVSYKQVDINKTYTPPILYVNEEYKMAKGSSTWKTSDNTMVSVDTVSPSEMLKNTKAIPVGNKLLISLNKRGDTKELYQLPSDAKIEYEIVKEGDNGAKATNAKRMKDGSFLIDIPEGSGEYICMVHLSFEDVYGMQSNYCIKINVK